MGYENEAIFHTSKILVKQNRMIKEKISKVKAES